MLPTAIPVTNITCIERLRELLAVALDSLGVNE